MDNDEQHRAAFDQTGYWGHQGAGAIIMARTTGRLLIPYRSLNVEQPHTWGVWGGAIDDGEDPKEAASREIQEEVGYVGSYLDLIPMYVYHDKEAEFKYFNFLAVVDDEFVPDLNNETDNFRWVKFGDWPKPLHFGLRALLQHSGNAIKAIIDKNEAGEKLSENNNPYIIRRGFYGKSSK